MSIRQEQGFADHAAKSGHVAVASEQFNVRFAGLVAVKWFHIKIVRNSFHASRNLSIRPR